MLVMTTVFLGGVGGEGGGWVVMGTLWLVVGAGLLGGGGGNGGRVSSNMKLF